MDERRAALDALETEIGGEAPPLELERCTDALFLALHGAPAEVQLEVARSALARYLPVFRALHPGQAWAEALLADVGAWHAAHGAALPDLESSAAGDPHFLFGLELLLFAWEHRDDADGVCSAAAGAVTAAAHGRAEHVWVHDDPEGVALRRERYELLRGGGEFPLDEVAHLFDPAHEPAQNAAFVAVARREWAHAAARLRELLPPDAPYDASAARAALERWRDAGYFPLPPA